MSPRETFIKFPGAGPRNANAFTLIELLVVIAILSLLMSLLLPSLTKAKELALQVVCQSNLRNMQSSEATFSSENNDVISYAGFMISLPNKTVYNQVHQYWWPWSINAMMGTPLVRGDSVDKFSKMMVCPTAKQNESSVNAYSYAINCTFDPNLPPDPITGTWLSSLNPSDGITPTTYGTNHMYRTGKLSALKNAANTPCFLDAWVWPTQSYPMHTGYVFTSPDNWYYSSPPPRHGRSTALPSTTELQAGAIIPEDLYSDGKFNASFFDGHCETLQKVPDAWRVYRDQVD